ncbi:hypothetical protein A0J61_00251 [Choanephora cucurbitarum]|uniref:SET domain-containing protein n=1 Tax=Choanephora cucurbitarum TaxID=101091 RepID=A0A1C7NRE7_9FUNG|nr:hypothetical protein A0J61_00251 [Choanephora cucurbitarum]
MQPANKDNLMNFKVLSRYDDLFTDIFLDNLYLWFSTIKMNNDHRRPRVPNTKILDIIQKHVLEKARPTDAVNELLALDYFRHYIASKNQRQVQEFVQHMKRYLYMYMPNAGYEIGDTRRYGGHGRRVEACLVATKDWHVGDEMRLLTGMIACLDPKDDAELKKGNRDFSVMWSTRKNCSCLFLGPARFANHDCDSNCKFISMGQNLITVKVLKEIQSGEEITVYYGKHYFGDNNSECKCSTCENLGMGYFASLGTPVQTEQGSTRRSTRKRKSVLQEEQKRSKRTSPTKTHSADSLEDLIGEEPEEPKKPFQPQDLPPMPVSPTTATTAKLKVMSIDFLCNKEETRERRTSNCPMLDMLVEAAMDAEYLSSNPTKTVIVNPEIHRDATQRILLRQQPQSTPDASSTDSKADSAISLSPPSHPIRIKAEQDDRCWQREMDDALFNQDDMDVLSDFLDDVSDLSSVSSTELSNWTSDEEEEEHVSKKKKSQQDLSCIACMRPLRREDISEQLGADVSVTNELATWTWTPSAIFTDWKPKRCPRCERHYTIFRQEWPSRKPKKKSSKKPKKKKTKKKPITTLSQDERSLDDYIPPSPLSEISHFEDEEITTF